MSLHVPAGCGDQASQGLVLCLLPTASIACSRKGPLKHCCVCGSLQAKAPLNVSAPMQRPAVRPLAALSARQAACSGL